MSDRKISWMDNSRLEIKNLSLTDEVELQETEEFLKIIETSQLRPLYLRD